MKEHVFSNAKKSALSDVYANLSEDMELWYEQE